MDALALHLFGDAPAGRESIREIDATIAELPGLEGMRLLEDRLDVALERALRNPGYAGTGPQAAASNGDRPAVATPARVP